MTNARLTRLIVGDWLRRMAPVVALAAGLVILCAARWIYVNPWPIDKNIIKSLLPETTILPAQPSRETSDPIPK